MEMKISLWKYYTATFQTREVTECNKRNYPLQILPESYLSMEIMPYCCLFEILFGSFDVLSEFRNNFDHRSGT